MNRNTLATSDGNFGLIENQNSVDDFRLKIEAPSTSTDYIHTDTCNCLWFEHEAINPTYGVYIDFPLDTALVAWEKAL